MSLFATAMSLSMMAAAGPGADEHAPIKVTKAGSAASAAGPASYFTGTVRINAPFQTDAPARVGGATVTFEPGARTAWHTHPLGQTLIVTAGAGRVQEWGKPAQEIRPGDIVWIPPGVKHWHGANATVAMSHIAIAEAVDGSPVTWLEQVSDAQYQGN
ncbi:(R)-mandelonitrile lyase [Xanthomonas campestris]|uniref:(R)-mandelonitrile lyase n=1 Tax=Xanthomonas campestris TaxID=339 RepID=UPI00021AEF16|nr:cupin domain-containing protein [Xanthomonas campestris]AEL07899.1 cupin domain protein [Xanthomonas campestris pv. raphani 756C]MEA9753987.1 cupin domain-containing protein [Xanthomonas campestris pv. raphani]MEA9765082.1 cupin domain-containing protein [Xanthomonas campestris pv. raphani]MEA9773757.1 cupin domain-containing protein [Xanthomonas campestris pv. raphani]MEA9815425.1 cupin domain-containing protein [Xanthomonas campestris pv. raphani]